MAAVVLAQMDRRLQQKMLSWISAQVIYLFHGRLLLCSTPESSQSLHPSTSHMTLAKWGVAISKMVTEGRCLYLDPKGQLGVVWA